MIKRIKEALLRYHREHGFTLYDSFPLFTKDPTLLFTNATITPFKHLFEDSQREPHNYAIVQRCLRVGGGAGELETARADPNYSSLFDMFGSGLFGCSYRSGVEYFLDMLGSVGLHTRNLRFTVPSGTVFAEMLLECGIDKSNIFTIHENGGFWGDWNFGKDGLVGKGLTAIYAPFGEQAGSADEMLKAFPRFVEIGNLIRIYGKREGDSIISISNEGFDVGMGVERIAIVLQGCTFYELTPFKELMKAMFVHLKRYKQNDPDPGGLRVMVDHLRSINALIGEHLTPGNKQHAFVLRKLIRSFLEILWLCVGRMIQAEEIVSIFARLDVRENVALITAVMSAEERVFRCTLERGRKVLIRNPSLDPETLRGTYGIRQSLIPLLEAK